MRIIKNTSKSKNFFTGFFVCFVGFFCFLSIVFAKNTNENNFQKKYCSLKSTAVLILFVKDLN
ncbi:hypothetical protein C4F50_09000 [Flavobacterium sp. KB82]|uniref:Lipoprotein n=1 Tax=Flavobacterium hungaricum TaxID=2082725 RepID=A0ABR9TI92_9FLAO|nr:hypothetical protein [Flavobacterium hungaricum]